METIEKPEFVQEAHLQFLNDLRESGDTNMFGAVPYVIENFPELTYKQGKEVLLYWMRTFKG